MVELCEKNHKCSLYLKLTWGSVGPGGMGGVRFEQVCSHGGAAGRFSHRLAWGNFSSGLMVVCTF